METTVIHVKQAPRGWEDMPLYEFIGRPSFLGNPYVVARWGFSREDAIGRYKSHLLKLRTDDQEYFDAYLIDKIYGHFLVCFCKPLACHGDVIKSCADFQHAHLGEADWFDRWWDTQV